MKIWKSTKINIELKLYKIIAKPAVMFASETWTKKEWKIKK